MPESFQNVVEQKSTIVDWQESHDPNKTRRHQLPTDPTAAGQYLAKRVDAEWMATMLEAYQQDDRLLLIKITFCFIIDA